MLFRIKRLHHSYNGCGIISVSARLMNAPRRILGEICNKVDSDSLRMFLINKIKMLLRVVGGNVFFNDYPPSFSWRCEGKRAWKKLLQHRILISLRLEINSLTRLVTYSWRHVFTVNTYMTSFPESTTALIARDQLMEGTLRSRFLIYSKII